MLISYKKGCFNTKWHSLKILYWALWIKPLYCPYFVNCFRVVRTLSWINKEAKTGNHCPSPLDVSPAPLLLLTATIQLRAKQDNRRHFWFPPQPACPELSPFNCSSKPVMSQKTGIFKGIMLEPKDLVSVSGPFMATGNSWWRKSGAVWMLRINQGVSRAAKVNLESQLRREAKKIRAGKVVLSIDSEVDGTYKGRGNSLLEAGMIGTGLKEWCKMK